MKKREKTRPFHFFILFVGAVVLASLIGFICLDLRAAAREMPFTRYLERLDRRIAEASFQDAERSLREFEVVPASARAWIRLLKRARIVAEHNAAPDLFTILAEKASEAFPDNETLRVLAVVAFMDSGDVKKAGLWAENHLKSREYGGVKAEAFLRAGILPAGTAEDEMLLAGLPASKDPAAFMKAGDLTETAEYYLDAGLLYLELGLRSQTADLFSRRSISERFPLPCALAAYDGGDYVRAEKLLSFHKPPRAMMAEKLLLIADLHLRTDRFREAMNDYVELRVEHPKVSMIPYLNAAALMYRSGSWSGRTILEEGFHQFPESAEMAIVLAKAYTALGNPKAAARMIERLEDRNQVLAAVRTLRLLSLRDSLTPARFIGELWVLRDTFPEDDALPKILAWLLVGTNDIAGIEEVLSRMNDEAWKYFYRGVIAHHFRDFGKAYEAFGLSLQKKMSPEASFNRGLSALETGRYKEALDSFRKAGEILRKSGKKDDKFEEKSIISSALCLATLKRNDESRKELAPLLTGERKSSEALRILRKLEGRH